MTSSTDVVRERTGQFEVSRLRTIEALLVTPEFHLAIILGLAAFAVQQLAFSKGRVSLVAPVVAVGATAVAVAIGFAVLGEPANPARTAAIVVVLVGTVFLTRNGGAS